MPSWAEVLDVLEQNLLAAGAAPAAETEAAAAVVPSTAPTHVVSGHWAPPAGLGPLPAHLVPRAAALVTALNDVATHTAAVRDDLGRQLAAVRSVPLAGDARSSVYLDITG